MGREDHADHVLQGKVVMAALEGRVSRQCMKVRTGDTLKLKQRQGDKVEEAVPLISTWPA